MISALLASSFLGSCAAWPLARVLPRRSTGWVLAFLPAGLFAGFLGFSRTFQAGQTVTERLPWAPTLGVDFTLRLDGFAYLFCLLVTGVGALVVIYAGAYLAERTTADRARFFALILFFMTAMLGAVLADDLLVLYLFWEATSLLSFLLIGFDGDSPSARRAALMSLRWELGFCWLLPFLWGFWGARHELTVSRRISLPWRTPRMLLTPLRLPSACARAWSIRSSLVQRSPHL